MNIFQIARFIRENYLIPLESYQIKSLQDVRNLHEELIKVRVELLVRFGFPIMPHYRGEQNYGWDISPGIFRPPFPKEIKHNNARAVEKYGAELFKQKVIETFGKDQLFKHSKQPYGEAWDLLFQAQHAGVKTNLIDVSTNSSRASFFACEPNRKHEGSDGQIWGLLVPEKYIYNETSEIQEVYPQLNPFTLNKSFVCNVPTYWDNIDERTYQFRLFKQHGRLFASSDTELSTPLNKKELWEMLIFRVRVPAKIKNIIFEELTKEGIDRKSMMVNESDEANELVQGINFEMERYLANNQD